MFHHYSNSLICLEETKIVCGCTLTNHAHLLLIGSKDAVRNANHVEKICRAFIIVA